MDREWPIQEHVSLRDWTTFSVGGPARYFMELRVPDDIPHAFAYAAENALPVFVLGGGSNVLVSDSGYSGLVLHMAMTGWTLQSENAHDVLLRVSAGEVWDTVVEHTVQHGWWGIENLSAIPGSVGAVPVQNVGAYGQEVADTIVSVEAWDRQASQWCVLTRDQCAFGYRQSIFNTCALDRYVITYVTFRLRRNGTPNLSHASVVDWLQRQACNQPSLTDMRQAIIAIRTDGRLPDVRVTGNVGSFFKHILLRPAELDAMRHKVAATLGSSVADQLYQLGCRFKIGAQHKLPAGALLQACDVVGWREGQAAQYQKNPLVLVNLNRSAQAQDVSALAQRIRACVREKTGIELDMEPRWIE